MLDLHKVIFFMIIWVIFRFILENMRILKYIEGYHPEGNYQLGSSRFTTSGVGVEHTVYDVNSYNPYCENNPNLCNKPL